MTPSKSSILGGKLFHNPFTRFDKRKFNRISDLVVLLVQKDLRVRYRGSILGYLWSMLNPLLYMAILSIIFSYVMKFKVENYPVFILTGIIS